MHGVSGLFPPAKSGRSRSFAFRAVGTNSPACPSTPTCAHRPSHSVGPARQNATSASSRRGDLVHSMRGSRGAWGQAVICRLRRSSAAAPAQRRPSSSTQPLRRPQPDEQPRSLARRRVWALSVVDVPNPVFITWEYRIQFKITSTSTSTAVQMVLPFSSMF